MGNIQSMSFQNYWSLICPQTFWPHRASLFYNNAEKLNVIIAKLSSLAENKAVSA